MSMVLDWSVDWGEGIFGEKKEIWVEGGGADRLVWEGVERLLASLGEGARVGFWGVETSVALSIMNLAAESRMDSFSELLRRSSMVDIALRLGMSCQVRI